LRQVQKKLIEFFKTHTIEAILLAEITKIEFCSVVWKKCRKNEINESLAQTLIDKFESDSIKFTFIDDNVELKESAKHLLEKHWKKGLRTLDSIQLASALSVNSTIDFMFTSDIILSEIAISENIQIG
jgi:predicted nucleic acid-binding protein